MSMLTLFTAPKPFTDPFIRTIQRNAIRSWMALGSDVQVILMGDDEGIAETAAELGLMHVRDLPKNKYGTPLVSGMFSLVRRSCASPLLGCVNADILLLPDFYQAARLMIHSKEKFLMVGQRWDMDISEELSFKPGWAQALHKRSLLEGQLHPASGSDYFLFPRACFQNVPPLAIGRAGWDNWMIYAGRRSHIPVVDATQAVHAIHQNHDYRHLPGGQPHYRLPESEDNVRIGGGRRTIFTLADVSHRLIAGQVVRDSITLKKVLRELEISPLIHLGIYPLAVVTHAIFHPVRFYGEVRGWLDYKLNRKKNRDA